MLNPILTLAKVTTSLPPVQEKETREATNSSHTLPARSWVLLPSDRRSSDRWVREHRLSASAVVRVKFNVFHNYVWTAVTPTFGIKISRSQPPSL